MDRAGSKVDAGHLRQEYADVSLLHLKLTDWRSDLSRREDSRCHLIEQRLKNVVVAPIDQDELDIGVPQRVRCGDPGKTAADDHDTLALRTRRLPDNRRLIRPSVSQHRAHWVTFVRAVCPSWLLSGTCAVNAPHQGDPHR